MKKLKSKTEQKTVEFDKAESLLCITDIFIDALEDHVDTISTREIMKFLGAKQTDIDNAVNEEYDLQSLRKTFKKRKMFVRGKMKDCFAIYETLENKYLKEGFN